MQYQTRQALLHRLHKKIEAGIPIIGAGAGTGLSAIGEASGGADLLIAYATGQYRMAGRSSLAGRFAFGDANQSVVQMLDEIIPAAGSTPVIAGIFAQAPYCDMTRLLQTLKSRGCCGVQNIPGMGGQAVMEGQSVTDQLEAAGSGFARETELIRLAHNMDLITTPYCSQPEHITQMAQAGADIFVLHMGVTGRQSDNAMVVAPLEECVERINLLADLALFCNREAIILAHGGPIVEPADLRYLMDRCPGLHGFYGASSIERIPVETQVRKTVQALKGLRINH